MGGRNFGAFVSSSLILTIAVVIIFAVLQWLQVPAGRLIDWVIAIACFWWLLVIVTVPWNIHFQARQVLADAAQSAIQGVAITVDQLAYVRRWMTRSLFIAVALHIFSALAMYALAATGVSVVGYLSAGAALLLTILRPSVRAYEYIVARLTAIGQELRYPRDDVQKLIQESGDLTRRIEQLEEQLDMQNDQSWASQQQHDLGGLRARLDSARVTLDDLQITNQSEHNRLARDAQNAIAQLSADGQFLSHVREIIRFVKEA